MMDISKINDIWRPDADSDLQLLPCPFCGDATVVYYKYQHLAGERFGVLCSSCMASIDPGYAQDKVTVQAMWNRRVVLNMKDWRNKL